MTRYGYRSAAYAFVALLLFPLAAVHADGASLYLSPESGAYALGDEFQVLILADTDGIPVSAAEAELTYDAGAFAVEDISTEGSILDTWLTRPDFDGKTIRFSGIARSPYAGSNGLLVTITFRALRNMLGTVRFSSGSLLSAEGERTNVIATMRSGAYRVRPEEVLPEPVATSSGSGEGTPTSAGPGGEVLGASTEGSRTGVQSSSRGSVASTASRIRDIMLLIVFVAVAGAVIWFFMRRRAYET